MKRYPYFIVLLLATLAPAQDKVRLGEIEFFGGTGMNVTAIRSAITLREGSEFSTMEELMAATSQIKETVERVAGRPPSDVDTLCCDDRGAWIIYVGLPGRSISRISYNPAPKGSARLSDHLVTLYNQTMDVMIEGVRQGKNGEDDSRGYSLSEYPPMRAKQLVIRDYAVRHEAEILRVLNSSRDAVQRGVAAYALGYVRQSGHQIAALVRASRDSDETVRNNAIRALAVLASSDPKVAARIPASNFIEMLNSGEWTDRNKGGWLLEILSQSRDHRLLGRLRSQTLDSLIEMARWRSGGHARPARILLGRIVGIEERRLQELARTGQVDEIIKSLSR